MSHEKFPRCLAQFEFQPGDIAACHGTDWTGRIIRWGTASLFPPWQLSLGPSHVAILCRWRGEMIWAESTTLCSTPCLVRNIPTEGAQAHWPEERVSDYLEMGGRVDVYRLTHFQRLTPAESQLLTRLLLDEFIEPGVSYDLGGALLSGTRVFQYSKFFPGANLEQLFCSELVAAVVMRLNRMNHANPSRYHPARLLRELIRIGGYQRVATFASCSQTCQERCE
ncbi:hypothetical protein SH668x_001906 [Planctomicrobium sp. SH668]|uniref:hypothetical protein n=1 Tax=Planctomicrobium sp. SH668 TaxID=3448126 RepID=UPI003F5BE8B7